jgi:hypothetical protein
VTFRRFFFGKSSVSKDFKASAFSDKNRKPSFYPGLVGRRRPAETPVKQILDLEAEGRTDDDIAAMLTDAGFRSPKKEIVLKSTVELVRLKHGRFHRVKGPCPRCVKGFLTLPQVAKQIGVPPHWIHRLIVRKVINVNKNKKVGLYLFPDRKKTIDDFHRLKMGKVKRLDY